MMITYPPELLPSPDEGETAEVVVIRYADDDRLDALSSALRTIRSAIPGYLKGEMTAEEFAILVIGEADSAKVNKALEKGR